MDEKIALLEKLKNKVSEMDTVLDSGEYHRCIYPETILKEIDYMIEEIKLGL